ncbi:MAG: hypothetical protein HQL31_11685 [Planctomycetes bacterium]|nr:hypothetical protein [Planctomycetota bacterium]
MEAIQDLRLIYPEVILTVGVLLVFLADLIAMKTPGLRRPLALGITLGALVLAGLALVAAGDDSGRVVVFSSMLTVDAFSRYFKTLFLIATFVVALFSYSSREVEADQEAEYYGILLSMTLAMCLLSSASNTLMLFLSIEFLSITSYVLAASSARTWALPRRH